MHRIPSFLRSLRWTSLLAAVAVTVVLAWVPIAVPAAPPDAEKLPLWSGQAPVGDGKFEAANASITVYPAPRKTDAAAVVICPGGGYGGLAVDPEGHGIARWLNQHGIAGVVLEYRLPKGRAFVPLLDAWQTKSLEWLTAQSRPK